MPISLNLKGRLGNHLFQYATLRNLSIIKGFDFYINLNISIQGQKCLLPYFNITNFSHPSKKIDYSYSQPVGSNHFDEKIYDINDDSIKQKLVILLQLFLVLSALFIGSCSLYLSIFYK